jgi:hypothetical protein
VVESPSSNPAGRPWRCLSRSMGVLPTSCTSQARGSTVAVHPSVLGSAVAPIVEVGEYAFIRDARGLHAQVVLAPGASADVPDQLCGALVAAIASTGPYRLWLTSSQSLPCNASPAAKSAWFDRFDQDHR